MINNILQFILFVLVLAYLYLSGKKSYWAWVVNLVVIIGYAYLYIMNKMYPTLLVSLAHLVFSVINLRLWLKDEKAKL